MYKHHKKKTILLYLIGALLFNSAYAQQGVVNKILLDKMSIYSKTHPTAGLFVHTDKTIYTNNEPIWFSGYLLKGTEDPANVHSILSVAVINEATKTVVAESKYIMKNDLSFGSLTLPDTIPPGNYQFIATTNLADKNNIPLVKYIQAITVKSISQQSFKAELSLKIPGRIKKGINVKFFPEGGNLLDGLETIVGWEARSIYNSPIALKGVLFKNDIPIDTISTNSYGIGRFNLNADAKNRYVLKVTANNYLLKDTIFSLPEVLPGGITLHLENAVVNDSLVINLKSKAQEKVHVLVHNYQDVFAAFDVSVMPDGNKIALVLPDDVPRGIATVTVLDAQDRPLAERLFFAHINQKINAEIRTDKKKYNKRERVTVRLKLTDQTGAPVQGIASMAAVQDSRLEFNKQQNIENYYYLINQLTDLPREAENKPLDNKDFLEKTLLVKGWRRYTWQSLQNSSVNDTLVAHTLPITGLVKYFGKSLKKPVNLLVVRDSALEQLTTNSDGSFVLDPEGLVVAADKKIAVSVNVANKEGYTIEINDAFSGVNQKLADDLIIAAPALAAALQTNTNEQLNTAATTINLKEVAIRGVKSDNAIYGLKARGSNACGDYVDLAGYLNYAPNFNNLMNVAPKKGQTYIDGTKFKLSDGRVISEFELNHGESGTKYTTIPITYTGCTVYKPVPFNLPAIYTQREFYPSNTDLVDQLSEPQYISTLFWKPGIIINNKGEAEYSFFTGDISGEFRIILQGVNANNLFYGEQLFNVN